MTKLLFEEDPYCRECDARVTSVASEGIALDQTVFYPSGGGQPGDTGALEFSDGRRLEIVDTRRDSETGVVWHVPAEGAGLPEPGERLHAAIDWERRYRLMRMHSCLHVLCAVVRAGVTGGQIHDGRGRLDFDLQEPLDKEALTRELNERIAEDARREFRWISDEELDRRPELVKTMWVQPPRGSGSVRLVEFDGIDLQPCGGTHVASTSEIGPVRVAKVEKKGRHNRRVTVVFDDQGN